jgi:WD40 repeat protein
MTVSLALSADGNTLYCSDNTGQLYLWDVRSPRLIGTVTVPGQQSDLRITLSPDERIVAANAGSAIYLFDTTLMRALLASNSASSA